MAARCAALRRKVSTKSLMVAAPGHEVVIDDLFGRERTGRRENVFRKAGLALDSAASPRIFAFDPLFNLPAQARMLRQEFFNFAPGVLDGQNPASALAPRLIRHLEEMEEQHAQVA